MKLQCCHIDCDQLASYELREKVKADGSSVRHDDFVHACPAHIFDLMTDAPVHEIVRLVAPGDPTRVYT